MRKIIVFFFVLISLSNFLYSMNDVKSPNIIERASYYVVYHPYKNPRFNATFYKYKNDFADKLNKYKNNIEKFDINDYKDFLMQLEGHTISFKEWNAEQQSKLDAMVDPKENLPITYAKINWHNIGTCCGRNITYYNNDQFIAIRPYNGPIDIKKDHLRIDLIKPHSLLDSIKKVEEWDDALPLHGIIGFFEPSYSYPYITRYIEYHKDGTSHETVTLQHKLIQGIYFCAGISLIYILYYLIISPSK